MLRAILAPLVLLLAACASVSPQPPEPRSASAPLRIAVIGDRTAGHRPDIFETAMDRVEAMQPDLVLSVGDLVEGYVHDEAELTRQWVEVEGLIGRFGGRFHAVPGNHDYSNDVQARLWAERRGSPYWSVRHGDVLILGLSTEDPPVALPAEAIEGHLRLLAALEADPEAAQARILQAYGERGGVTKPGEVHIGDGQVAWARGVLAENTDAHWTIVLMHKPAWRFDNANFHRIEAMLADRDHTVIAGHEHYYEHEKRGGRDYFIMGTTGGIWLRDGPGRVDHIMWITFGEEGEPSYLNIGIDGTFPPQGPASGGE